MGTVVRCNDIGIHEGFEYLASHDPARLSTRWVHGNPGHALNKFHKVGPVLAHNPLRITVVFSSLPGPPPAPDERLLHLGLLHLTGSFEVFLNGSNLLA